MVFGNLNNNMLFTLKRFSYILHCYYVLANKLILVYEIGYIMINKL